MLLPVLTSVISSGVIIVSIGVVNRSLFNVKPKLLMVNDLSPSTENISVEISVCEI